MTAHRLGQPKEEPHFQWKATSRTCSNLSGCHACPKHQPPPTSLVRETVICPVPLPSVHPGLVSADLTVPPSWTFLVTERREERASLLASGQGADLGSHGWLPSPSCLVHVGSLPHISPERSQVTQPLSGGAKTRTQASCPQLPRLPRGQGFSGPEKSTLPGTLQASAPHWQVAMLWAGAGEGAEGKEGWLPGDQQLCREASGRS